MLFVYEERLSLNRQKLHFNENIYPTLLLYRIKVLNEYQTLSLWKIEVLVVFIRWLVFF